MIIIQKYFYLGIKLYIYTDIGYSSVDNKFFEISGQELKREL